MKLGEHKTPNGSNVLMIAASKGDLKMVQYLMDEILNKRGLIQVNEENLRGLSAVDLAALNGHLSVVTYLIEYW